MPDIDRDKLRISLERSSCYGSCPDYAVTIDGHGNVIFQSRDRRDRAIEIDQIIDLERGILFPGRHTDKIPEQAVDALIEQAQNARFFDLSDEYRSSVTDNPTYVVTIDTGNGKKSILDYVGEDVGMPPSISALEDAIDKAAGTDRWVKGTKGLLQWLDKGNFDYRSDLSVAVAIFGSRREADDELLLGMIERGLPLEKPFRYHENDTGVVGSELVRQALSNGLPLLLARLAKLGWLDRLGRDEAGQLFAENAAGCTPELVDIADRLKIPIDAPGRIVRPEPIDDEPVTDEDWTMQNGRTALAELASHYRCAYNEQKRLQTAQKLLRHGANPNHRNAIGETAIFGVENLALLQLLYANGADAKITGNRGNSAVFSSWTDEIVLLHLQNGASTEGRYFDGKTLQEQMKERPMPKVLKWLENHGR